VISQDDQRDSSHGLLERAKKKAKIEKLGDWWRSDSISQWAQRDLTVFGGSRGIILPKAHLLKQGLDVDQVDTGFVKLCDQKGLEELVLSGRAEGERFIVIQVVPKGRPQKRAQETIA
jgi:hypothetical protein